MRTVEKREKYQFSSKSLTSSLISFAFARTPMYRLVIASGPTVVNEGNWL